MCTESATTNTQRKTIDSTAAAPIAQEGGVKGWLLYDPQTGGFRQSSIDQETEAAQTLVDACEQAFDASPVTTCGCEQEEEDSHLLRRSFAFVVNDEYDLSSPSVSPFSDAHGESDTTTSTATTCDGLDDETQEQAASEQTPSAVNGNSPETPSPSPRDNTIYRGISSLTFFPPLRETRLSSHRGSVMEAGVVLDTTIFGGIGIVQSGRKVDVKKSVSVAAALRG